MSLCDLCSMPLGTNATRYSASQFRKAVQQGLRPNSVYFELGAAFGMSKQDAEQVWLRQVLTDNTDYLLCSTCATRCEVYMPKKTWWQFWKEKTSMNSCEEERHMEDAGNLDASTFFEAIKDGEIVTVRQYLENGFDPNTLDDSGRPALLYVAAIGHMPFVELLLAKGANPNKPGADRFFPLHFAVFNNHIEIVRLLLEHDAEVDPRNPTGYTPLYDAAAEGHVELARLLINRGADVSARGGDSSTPLHAAAFNGHAEIAELLLRKGASPFTKNNQGVTALMAAGIKENGEIMRIIARQRMAERGSMDVAGDTCVLDDAQDWCKKAASLRQNWSKDQNLQRAEQLYRAATEQFPECWMAHFGLGEILAAKIGNERLVTAKVADEALAELKIACRLAPDRREPQLKLAVEYARTDILSAEVAFRRAVDHCDNRHGSLYPLDWQASDYFSFAIAAANNHETLGLSLEAFCRAIILKPDYYGGEVKPANSLPAAIWTTALLVRPDGGKAIFEQTDSLSPDLRAAVNQAYESHPDRKIGQLHNASLMYYEKYQNELKPEYIHQALALEKEAWEVSPDDFPERYKIASHYGVLLQKQYDLAGQVDDLFQSAVFLDYTVSHANEADPRRAGYLDNLSTARYRLYEYNGDRASLEQSIECLNQAVSLTPSLSPSLPLYLSRLGVCYLALYKMTSVVSDLRKAVTVLDQALERAEVESLYLPIILTHRGVVRRNLFHRTAEPIELERAIADFEAAIKSTPETPKHAADLAIRLNDLANALADRYKSYQQIEDLDRAIECFKGALEHNESPGRQTNYAAALLERYWATDTSDDLNQAITVLRKAIAGSSHQSPYYTGILLALGKALGIRNTNNDLRQALDCFEKASDLDSTVAIGIALTAAMAWLNSAFLSEFWSEAIEAYSRAANAREQILASQILSDDKYLWLAETQTLPAIGAYAFGKMNRLEEAVEAVETGRARVLGETLERSRHDLERLADPVVGRGYLLKHYRDASDLYNGLLRRESTEDRSSAILERSFDQMQQIEAAQAKIQDSIAQIRQVPGYANFLLTFKAEQIKPLAREAPLVYLMLTEAGGLALVVEPEGVQEIWLDVTKTDLDDKINRIYLPAILGKGSLQVALNDLLPWLGEKIMKKIAIVLHGHPLFSKSVILIPTGHLALLPLHAAQYTFDETQRAFLDDFTVCYTPSAQMLSHARSALEQLDYQPKNFFGVVNPLPQPKHVKPLDFAEFELKEIVPLFTAHNTLYGDKATLEAVKAYLSSSSHLHFSCHGFFNPEEPLKSGVVLANGKMLTLSDLRKGDQLSQARLAVLSACQTAVSDFKKLPEEAIGLAAGFLQAGVPGVIGSLWPVDDLSTALLMQRFYMNHLWGSSDPSQDTLSLSPPAKALRRAQIWLRDQVTARYVRDYLAQALDKGIVSASQAMPYLRGFDDLPDDALPFASPYYWAAFAIYGV